MEGAERTRPDGSSLVTPFPVPQLLFDQALPAGDAKEPDGALAVALGIALPRHSDRAPHRRRGEILGRVAPGIDLHLPGARFPVAAEGLEQEWAGAAAIAPTEDDGLAAPRGGRGVA